MLDQHIFIKLRLVTGILHKISPMKIIFQPKNQKYNLNHKNEIKQHKNKICSEIHFLRHLRHH